MDSDSDSDSDVEVVPAKRPATTRRKLVPIKNVESKPTKSIYMSKVDQTMKAIHSRIEPALGANTSDVEEDAEEIFSTKTKSSRARKQPARLPRESQKQEDKQQDVIDLGSSDTENDPEVNISVEQNDSMRERERSPTPPPELRACLSKRAPRRTKALKNAVSALEDLNFRQKLREAVDRVHDMDNDVVIVDETVATPSPMKTVPVKVRSLSGLHRFSINKADSFTKVLEELAAAEGVSVDRCVLFKEDKTVEPYDSPQSINLHIADILELHIRKENELTNDTLDLDDPDVIELSVQTKDPKSKLLLPIHKNTRLEKVMRDFAKQRNLDFNKLTFYFDGEIIQQSQTPAMLEMESNDCIDVAES